MFFYRIPTALIRIVPKIQGKNFISINAKTTVIVRKWDWDAFEWNCRSHSPRIQLPNKWDEKSKIRKSDQLIRVLLRASCAPRKGEERGIERESERERERARERERERTREEQPSATLFIYIYLINDNFTRDILALVIVTKFRLECTRMSPESRRRSHHTAPCERLRESFQICAARDVLSATFRPMAFRISTCACRCEWLSTLRGREAPGCILQVPYFFRVDYTLLSFTFIEIF